MPIKSYNKIQNLSNLENCPNLTILDIDNNGLDKIPEKIIELKKLKMMNVSNNNLNNLPPELALLSDLTKLNIEGNPLKSIKSSLRTGSTEALKKHLKMKLTDDKEDLKYQEELKIKSEISGSGSALWDNLIREFYIAGKLDVRDKVFFYY